MLRLGLGKGQGEPKGPKAVQTAVGQARVGAGPATPGWAGSAGAGGHRSWQCQRSPFPWDALPLVSHCPSLALTRLLINPNQPLGPTLSFLLSSGTLQHPGDPYAPDGRAERSRLWLQAQREPVVGAASQDPGCQAAGPSLRKTPHQGPGARPSGSQSDPEPRSGDRDLRPLFPQGLGPLK